ncbi:fructose-bisphosphate aldolase [Hydrogenispora ethanolica]|jgi:fructose-bisphosphate aldolase class II|uniref:Fructose-bisphosphate aldolase n=1 Tax=Hydrogenispora ethanolica TaxID=1082276 RepID=A0A4R1QT81_HYDET|nr:ketose-bisphosphate aldolase [Hydrogenispora ethanolica]TCL57129.1 fructose-bisphosphate aldolase [Hydrogenispora ethanolica]
MLVTSKAILEASLNGFKEGKPFAIGAYNVNNMEQMQGIMKAARETQSPVIVQVSRGALKYAEDKYLRNIVMAGVELNPDIPVALHLDHGNNMESVKRAIDLGFTSVMIDGSLMEDSKTPSDFAYNVKITSEVVKYAHDRGVSVEGEIGTLGGIEDGVGSGQTHLTKPEEAAEFVEKTGVDSLAISIGTSHGAYKFKGEAKIAYDVIESCRKLLPNVYLVSHGSSSVPKELIDIINQYGGKMEHAAGMPLEALQKAIQAGINKINVDTDIRLAATAATRKYLADNPSKFDQRDYAGAAREAVAQEIMVRMKGFGTTGHAKDVPNWGLAEMKAKY